MYEIVSEKEGRALGVTIREAFAPADREQVTAYLREQSAGHGQIAVLFDLDDLPPASVDDVVDGLADGLAEARGVTRVAVVGNEHWERREQRLSAVFPAAEIQFFGVAHLAEAWSWIRGKV